MWVLLRRHEELPQLRHKCHGLTRAVQKATEQHDKLARIWVFCCSEEFLHRCNKHIIVEPIQLGCQLGGNPAVDKQTLHFRHEHFRFENWRLRTCQLPHLQLFAICKAMICISGHTSKREHVGTALVSCGGKRARQHV